MLSSVNAVKGSDYDNDTVTAADLEKLFGPAGAITIYTGKITFVGDHHIEYSVNSFKGCSGAIVFLLNYDQPEESVKKSDYGKAIAVHAGFATSLGTNLGFKLNDPQLNDPQHNIMRLNIDRVMLAIREPTYEQ